MNISFLTGLPRSGGTLLSSILSQNPNIKTTGNSPLAHLMWGAQEVCKNAEPMVNYPGLQDKYISSIAEIMYGKTNINILDKSGTWGLQGNITLIKKYINTKPKFIVMARPLIDVVKSFIYIRQMNGWTNPEAGLLDDNSDPIIRPYYSLRNLMRPNDLDILFIKYDNFIENPNLWIDKIYDFMNWDYFNHDYFNIQNKNEEQDDLLNLVGLHNIRPTISKRNINVEVSSFLLEKANYLDIYNQIK